MVKLATRGIVLRGQNFEVVAGARVRQHAAEQRVSDAGMALDFFAQRPEKIAR